MDFYQFPSPLGEIALASEDGQTLSRLYLPNMPTPRLVSRPTPLLKDGERQLTEYFAGRRQTFDLPLGPHGTAFQWRVWFALQKIPYGCTISYKQLAQGVNCPQGFRAVGMANRANPLPIIIPCHRVIASDGSLGGYIGGSELKRALLHMEGVSL